MEGALYNLQGQRGSGLLAAAAAEQVAQAALLAHAVGCGEDDGQIAAVQYAVEHAALRAAQDEQKNEDPQAAVIAAEVSEAVH